MDAPALESAPCPLGCAAGDVPVLRGRDRLLGLPGEFAVVRCAGCGLMRTDPRPTQAAMAAYYPESYHPYADTQVAKGEERRAKGWRESLNRALPPLGPGRLLEVGCGSGVFLAEMARSGWRVEGIEPSRAAGQAARAAGFAVHVGALETAPEPMGPFDLIAGWMVLEHLHQPVAALARLARSAAPGGWLAVSVPDAGSWELAAFGAAWYGLDLPRHLYHYTPAALGRLLAAGGWRVERVMWQRDPKNLLHSTCYVCRDRGWERAAAWLAEAAVNRRVPHLRAALGQLLGRLHASGRITVWARRA